MNKIEQLRHLSRKLVRELGMLQLNQPNSNRTPGHWHALVEISKDPKITISQLGHLLLISTSSISRIIKSLAKEGLVELKEGQNKKEKAIDLTEAGYAALKEVDSFSENKVAGAFEFLTEKDIVQIVDSIDKYSNALEKSRLQKEQVKIATLSTSRTIRQQIVRMMEDIQIKEFGIPITPEINICVLKAEHTFYFNNSYNFWYATDDQGEIIGTIGLKKINDKAGELKKFFVSTKYRGKGVAQKLIQTLLKNATKHGFETIFLGTTDKYHAAHRFYIKCGFKEIKQKDLPDNFELCPVDSIFFGGEMEELLKKLG